MQWGVGIRGHEIAIWSESRLAFAPPQSSKEKEKAVLPLQYSCARLLQAMDFMMQLPQSEEMRRNMVDSQLRTNGVNAPWILAAMLATPREAFVPKESAAASYMDRSIPLGGARMLNPPLATGLMLNMAEPAPADRVLLIGAGTGYMAALLAGRVAALVAVEQAGGLADSFKSNVPAALLVEGPLAEGAAGHGPYDLILIDGGIERLPDILVDQLDEGGRIVTGLIDGPVSRLASGVKRGGHVALRPVIDTELAPLPGFERTREFVF
jgi:protein-L-isoaspartate(D-aspartate) O-methyltransferase